MTMLTDGMTSSESTEWGTGDGLFLPLNEQWNFTLDGAASFGQPGWAVRPNAKVDRFCTQDGTWVLWNESVDEAAMCDCAARARHRSRWTHTPECLTLAPRIVVDDRVYVRTSPDDGLTANWSGERVFLNPPWGDPEQPCGKNCRKKRCAERGWHAKQYIPGIEDFLRHAVREVLWNRAMVALVVPARTDTIWFHNWVLPNRPRFYRGRPRFIDPITGEEGKQPPVGIATVELR